VGFAKSLIDSLVHFLSSPAIERERFHFSGERTGAVHPENALKNLDNQISVDE
jgi:hypothetical protein